MSRTLMVSDERYQRLESMARQRGLAGVEELLETWRAPEEEKNNRQRVVEQIDALRANLFAKYGAMPDSVELIREDRAR